MLLYYLFGILCRWQVNVLPVKNGWYSLATPLVCQVGNKYRYRGHATQHANKCMVCYLRKIIKKFVDNYGLAVNFYRVPS